MEAERRKFPRLPFDTGVDYKLLKQEGDAFFSTASKNISVGGICIITYEPLNSGDILELKFSLPLADKFITAKGRVAWTGNLKIEGKNIDAVYEAGIEFISIDEKDMERIQRYVELGVA